MTPSPPRRPSGHSAQPATPAAADAGLTPPALRTPPDPGADARVHGGPPRPRPDAPPAGTVTRPGPPTGRSAPVTPPQGDPPCSPTRARAPGTLPTADPAPPSAPNPPAHDAPPRTQASPWPPGSGVSVRPAPPAPGAAAPAGTHPTDPTARPPAPGPGPAHNDPPRTQASPRPPDPGVSLRPGPPAPSAAAPADTHPTDPTPGPPAPGPARTAPRVAGLGSYAHQPPPAGGSADAAWDGADPYAHALRSGGGPLFLRRRDGWLLPLEVERWCGVPDGADVTVLRRCTGPVLDIGCGPGRLVAALAALGRPALGIDVSSEAVAHARSRGGAVLHRSVFDPLPGEGRWGTALLIDGNVGIGGDPAALLARAAAVLRPGGRLVVEVAADDDVDERVQVHVTDEARGHRGARRPDGARHGAPFPWARVGLPALLRYASAGRWREEDRWTAGERRFAALRAPAQTPRTARR